VNITSNASGANGISLVWYNWNKEESNIQGLNDEKWSSANAGLEASFVDRIISAQTLMAVEIYVLRWFCR
jgi:hypothetical protein